MQIQFSLVKNKLVLVNLVDYCKHYKILVTDLVSKIEAELNLKCTILATKLKREHIFPVNKYDVKLLKLRIRKIIVQYTANPTATVCKFCNSPFLNEQNVCIACGATN